jgi:hypothetical protein
MVTFRPEDPRTPKFIADAKSRGLKAGLWFADPSSADSVAYGIKGDAVGFADDVVRITKDLDTRKFTINGKEISASPQLVQLNIEFTGKGYPTWKANTKVKAWHRWTANGFEWQTFTDGTTGATRPAFQGDGVTPIFTGMTVKDNDIIWHCLGQANFNGWDWNETVAARLRRKVSDGGIPTRPLVVQPMGNQGDFNYGAYYTQRQYSVINGVPQLSPRARISPQCYDGNNNPMDPEYCINVIADNGYVLSHYGETINKAYIHPTLFANNSAYYLPKMQNIPGARGYSIFRMDYMGDSDYTAYASYMLV